MNLDEQLSRTMIAPAAIAHICRSAVKIEPNSPLHPVQTFARKL